MNFCSKCGLKTVEGAVFCAACGTPISTLAQPQLDSIPHHTSQAPSRGTDDAALLFVGKNYDYFVRKWGIASKSNYHTSWNWMAFILGPIWLGYRKMHSYAWLCIAFGGTVALLSAAFGWPEKWSRYPYMWATIMIAWQGNYWYKLIVEKRVAEISSAYPTDEARIELARRGNTSLLAAVGILFALLALGGISEYIGSGSSFLNDFKQSIIGGSAISCDSKYVKESLRTLTENRTVKIIDVIESERIPPSGDTDLFCLTVVRTSNANSQPSTVRFLHNKDGEHFVEWQPLTDVDYVLLKKMVAIENSPKPVDKRTEEPPPQSTASTPVAANDREVVEPSKVMNVPEAKSNDAKSDPVDAVINHSGEADFQRLEAEINVIWKALPADVKEQNKPQQVAFNREKESTCLNEANATNQAATSDAWSAAKNSCWVRFYTKRIPELKALTN